MWLWALEIFRQPVCCWVIVGAVFLPCWLFVLRHPSSGAYSLLGGVLVPKWQPSGELMPMNMPWYLRHQCLCLHSDTQLPPFSSGDPPRLAGKSGPGSYEVIAFALGPGMHETLFAPSKSGDSASSSPVELLQSSLPGLQRQMLWGILLLMPDPRLGTLMWGSELHSCGRTAI